MSDKDNLGNRQKANFENRTRYYLPRRTYSVARYDGHCFSAYCRHLQKPFDAGFAADMDTAAVALCEEIQGAQLAYIQSDEISVLFTDFAETTTEAWFDGNVQKIASVGASIATAAFNDARHTRWTVESCRDVHGAPGWDYRPATFDGRVFTIPDPTECDNYFRWRQADARRNSIAMTAQAYFSPKQLHGKSGVEMLAMLQDKGVEWVDYPAGFRLGRCIVQEQETKDVVYTDKRTGEERCIEGVERHVWRVVVPPVFTEDPKWLRERIPQYP